MPVWNIYETVPMVAGSSNSGGGTLAWMATPPRVLEILPEGIDPPAHIPPEIFRAAVRTHLEPRRLDMQALAAELGIGRTTLYRRVGDRDALLGEVLWYLARQLLAQALMTPDRRTGRRRVVGVMRRFMDSFHDQPPHRRLLEEEPEAALRILTSKHGPVQRGVVEVAERLLAREEERGTMRLSMPRDKLAYAIVRISESFLYADIVADAEPDVGAAIEVIDALLAGTAQQQGVEAA
jgi:AcrR family transcriptional regulator